MFLIPAISIITLVFIDQYTKYIAFIKLKPINSIFLIEGLISFTYVENRGAAFGILQGGRIFFIILTVIILISIFYYYIKLPKQKLYNLIKISLVLIISGAIGNLIDRAKNGYVIDFISITFINFPIFNFADIYVVLGTVSLAIFMFYIDRKEGKKFINKKTFLIL